MSAAILASAAGAGLSGCGSALPACPDKERSCAGSDVGGDCAGVPVFEPDAEPCTTDFECERVVKVDSDEALQSAAADTSSGTCIALAPGYYGDVTLHAGVSLLGGWWNEVTVEGITVEGAAGAAESVVRQVFVGLNGIEAKGGARLRVEAAYVGSAIGGSAGLRLQPGSSARVSFSELDSSGYVVIHSIDADLTIEQSVIQNGNAGGVWFEGTGCDSSCNCTKSPSLTIRSTLLQNNLGLGLHVRGASAALENVDITGTSPGAGAWAGRYGDGILLSACADLQAKKVRSNNNAGWGILINGSKAQLGGEDPADTVEISGNLGGGLWIEGACSGSPLGGPPCVTVQSGLLQGNAGVGAGISGGSRGVVVSRSTIEGTFSQSVPIGMSLAAIAGHGVVWRDESEATLDEVTLSQNALVSLLIDGPASGAIQSLTLKDGDDLKPPLQQQLMMGGSQPAHDASVPLSTDPMIKWPVPSQPSVPPQLPPP